MCDCYTPQGEPIPTNKRYNAAKVFSHPDVAAEVPWYEYWLNFRQCFFSLENISILLYWYTGKCYSTNQNRQKMLLQPMK